MRGGIGRGDCDGRCSHDKEGRCGAVTILTLHVFGDDVYLVALPRRVQSESATRDVVDDEDAISACEIGYIESSLPITR